MACNGLLVPFAVVGLAVVLIALGVIYSEAIEKPRREEKDA